MFDSLKVKQSLREKKLLYIVPAMFNVYVYIKPKSL